MPRHVSSAVPPSRFERVARTVPVAMLLSGTPVATTASSALPADGADLGICRFHVRYG